MRCGADGEIEAWSGHTLPDDDVRRYGPECSTRCQANLRHWESERGIYLACFFTYIGT